MTEVVTPIPEHIRWQQADARRTQLYTEINKVLPRDSRVFYPASGADRLPAKVFGSNIIYGVYHKAFLDDLSLPVSQFPRYTHLPAITLPNWVEDDLKDSKLKDNQFDLILVRGVGEMYTNPSYDNIYSQLYRQLKQNGLLIVEDERMEPKTYTLDDVRRGFIKFKAARFVEHELDGKFGDIVKKSEEDARRELLARFAHHPSKAQSLLEHGFVIPPYNPYRERSDFHIMRVLQKK